MRSILNSRWGRVSAAIAAGTIALVGVASSASADWRYYDHGWRHHHGWALNNGYYHPYYHRYWAPPAYGYYAPPAYGYYAPPAYSYGLVIR